eukprot:12635366-Ditylum_brightwellii.AAC.1
MASDNTTSGPIDTNTANSTTAMQHASPWRGGSPRHVEFLALCEHKQWDTLPVLDGDAYLDKFWREGLHGGGVEFTRAQLISKF